MKFKIKNKLLETEVVRSPFKIIKGLSFSSKKRNMLFIMPYESRWSFWMFGMLYPIYITFLDKNKNPLETLYAKPLTLDPKTWRIYKPKVNCKYILETYEEV